MQNPRTPRLTRALQLKRCHSIVNRALAICVLHLIIAAAVRAEVIDRVLAVVAGELIMLSDVTAARDLKLVQPGRSRTGGSDAAADEIGAVLSQLIDRELILAQVERYEPPEPSAEAIDRELQRVRARFQSAGAFAQALSRSGIDEQHLRETLREDLRIRAYEDERFTVSAPNDAELARYYREHPQTFTRDGKLTPLDEARPEILRALTQELRDAAVASWVEGLRRRADIIDLYTLTR